MKGVRSVCIVCNVEFTNGVNSEEESKLPSLFVKLWQVFCNYFHVQSSKFEDILDYFCSVAELPFCDGSCRNDVAELFILHEKLGSIQKKIKNLTTNISVKIVESTEHKNKTKVVEPENIFDSVLCDEKINQRIREMRREIAQYYKPNVVLVNTYENETTKTNKNETSTQNSLVNDSDNDNNSRDSSKSVLEALTSSKKVVTTEKEKDDEETLNLSTDCLLRRLLFKSNSADSIPAIDIKTSADNDKDNNSNVIKRVGEKSFLFYKEWLVFFKNPSTEQWKWTDPKALFSCATCQEEFRGQETMKNHIYHSHHNSSTRVEDSSEKNKINNAQNQNFPQLFPTFSAPSPFKCHVTNCNLRFVNMASFLEHLQQSHNIQKKVWLDKPSNQKESEPNQYTSVNDSDDDDDDEEEGEDEYNDNDNFNYDDSSNNNIIDETEPEPESDFSMETEVDPLALDTQHDDIIVKHESEPTEFLPVPPENIIFEATLENSNLLTQNKKKAQNLHHHMSKIAQKQQQQPKTQRILPRPPPTHFIPTTTTITSTTTNLIPPPSSSAIAITPMGVLLQNINHIPCSSSVLTLSSIPQLILHQNQTNQNNFQNFYNNNNDNNNDNCSSSSSSSNNNNRILDLSRKRKGDPKEDQRKRRMAERHILEELKSLIIPQFPRLASDNCRIAHILVDARKHIDVLRENEIRLKNEKQRLLRTNADLLKLKNKYEYSYS